jgi:hypothetical protein
MATPPTFTAGQVLTAAQMNLVGLWEIKTVTFTAQSPVNVTDVFSDDFDHYRILASIHGSAASFCRLQYLVGTTPETGLAYGQRGWSQSGTTLAAYSATGTDNHFFNQYGNTAATFGATVCDVFNPQKATRTAINVRNVDMFSADTYDISGQCTSTSQFTGFRLTAVSGTLTGTIRVYGYRN